MSPKEKAHQLVNMFYAFVLYENELTEMNGRYLPMPSKRANAKRCALEAVNEISMAVIDATGDELGCPHAIYWAMVREEIELMGS